MDTEEDQVQVPDFEPGQFDDVEDNAEENLRDNTSVHDLSGPLEILTVSSGHNMSLRNLPKMDYRQ